MQHLQAAKVPKHLFRAIPPKEFVEDILHKCGFEEGFADRRVVTKVSLMRGVQSQDDWLPFLEPYYLPCKARRFFGAAAGPLDAARLVTILRHILRPHDSDLTAQEVAENGTKHTLYQIQPVSCQNTVLSAPDLEVTFA
jgi:hypothetical protein